MAKVALPIVVAVLLVSAPVHAEDYFVATTGSNSDTGLTGHPWATVQHAFDSGLLAPGDTVTVEDGSYPSFYCDSISGTALAPIVIQARRMFGARIDSADPTAGSVSQDFIQLSSCSYVVIHGFEVTGAARSGIAVLGNTDTGDDARGVVIEYNWSHHNGGTSAVGRHDGVFSGFALDLIVHHNLIHDTGEHGIYVSNAADNPIIFSNQIHDTGANGIQINADLSTGGDGIISNWRIDSNIVSNCRGSAALNLDGVVDGIAVDNVIVNAARGGITLFQGDGAVASSRNVIVNNSVYDPTGTRAAIQIADGANDNVVFNNILIGASGIEQQSVTGFMHDYNLVSSYDGATPSAHESTPDPATLFASTTDLTLALLSPAIDTGIDTFGGATAPSVDFFGLPRPQNAGFDIGAYEVFGGLADGGVGPDAGGGDAGPGVDAGPSMDAGAGADGGTSRDSGVAPDAPFHSDGGPGASGGGCCSVAGARDERGGVVLCALGPIAVMLRARRRRSG